MNIKQEKTRSTTGIKILNDEKIINTSKPTPIIMTTVPLSPTKQITMSIAKSKPVPQLKQTNMDHYMLQTVKGEADAEGYVGETIDFILTDSNGEDKTFGLGNPSGEITEELHLSGEEEDDEGDDHDGGEMKTEEIIEHVCGKCYKTFRRVSGLKKHLDFCRFDSGYHLRKAEMFKNLQKIEKDAVIMENKDICFCCGESYDTFHLGHISCPDCPKSFKSQSSYERHIFITHSEFNDHPCEVCNAKLRSQNLLILHMEQHQTRGKPYACKICGKEFTRSYHLKRHQKYSSCSADISDAMSCKVCQKTFFRLDNLRAHLKQHLGDHSAKKSEYMCPICKNCFYSLSTLNIHTRTHTGERPFDCDLCDKKFPSLVALKKHRRYHTGEKPYTCSVCSQSFAVKEVLNRHMKRHTGERPHVCTECKKSFIQATQLRNHMRTHLRPFSCIECVEKFKTQKQLERHARTHQVKSKTRTKITSDFSCRVCNINFKHFESLTRHLKTKAHLTFVAIARKSERTDCALCEKNFNTVQNLEFHILKVHEVDPEEFINEKRLQKIEPTDLVEMATIAEEKDEDDMPLAKRIKQEKISNNIAVVNDDVADDVEMFDAEHFEFISTKTIKQKHDAPNELNSGDVVLQEFILDEMPTSSKGEQTIFMHNNDAFTVIPLDSDLLAETIRTAPETTLQASDSKTPPRKSLAESLAAAIADEEEEATAEGTSAADLSNAEDEKLKDNVCKLLDMLVDKMTLKKFGWPENSVENVLCKVIENCGHDLSKDSDEYRNCDFSTRMREYVKLLFTVVIQNDSIKELLNNYPIDEVIEYVLGNDDDDEDDDDDVAEVAVEAADGNVDEN